MDTTIAAQDTIEPVLTLGPELRFRRSEVDSWLARLEAAECPPSVGGSGMSRGRPGTAMTTFGQVHATDLGGRHRALTRFRDTDGHVMGLVEGVSSSVRTRRCLLP